MTDREQIERVRAEIAHMSRAQALELVAECDRHSERGLPLAQFRKNWIIRCAAEEQAQEAAQ